MLCVARDVAGQLGAPITFVRFGFAGVETVGIRMQMPEAAMHEDHFAPRPEHEIGFAGQVATVEAVAVAEGEDEAV